MDFDITREQVDNGTISETSLHRFTTEASDLGWRPDKKIPTQLTTNLGNGQPFLLTTLDTQKAIYHQSLGCIVLTIFND